MAKTVGYMVTWTTYGTWLQGDQRGYVKNGMVFEGNIKLEQTNKIKQKNKEVKLKDEEREIVKNSIKLEAENVGEEISAISVCSTHVHMVCRTQKCSVDILVSRLKNAAYFALKRNGFVGRLWTRGYDKRFCFDQVSLNQRIEYVRKHNV